MQENPTQLRSLRAARVPVPEPLMLESDMVEPEPELRMVESVEDELLIVEPELRGVVAVLPDDVDGVVMVLASVERPVLGVVDIVPEVEPVLGVVDIVPDVEPVLGEVDIVPDVEPVLGVVDVLEPDWPVGAGEPGLVVPVDDGVVAVGLVDDGPPVAPALPEVCACAKPIAPIKAAIEAAAVSDFENLIIENSCSNG